MEQFSTKVIEKDVKSNPPVMDTMWQAKNTNQRQTSTQSSPNLTSTLTGFAHFLYVLTIYRYVLLCLLFGLMSVIIGVSLLTLSLILRSKTTSMYLLESVPLYMPGLILICNGTSMIAFMNKNTRRFYLLKSVCGLFLLVALLLIVVSVTTSVIHIPRLHSHRECAYTQRLRACTCVQTPAVHSTTIASKHFIMEEILDCESVHGIIYDSLRVAFALAIISILVSIFSIMTLYQIYIHEKQKLYRSNVSSVFRQRFEASTNSPQHNHHTNVSLGQWTPFDAKNTATITTTVSNIGPLSRNLDQTSFKCLSAEFSSQDLLIQDQSSTNFGVSKHNHKHYSNKNFSKSSSNIWSSQLSSDFDDANPLHNHPQQPQRPRSQTIDRCSSDSKSYSNLNTTSIGYYLQAVLDSANNVRRYCRERLAFWKPMGAMSMPTVNYDRVSSIRSAQAASYPPHVVIPRCSIPTQSSFDSTTNVNSAHHDGRTGVIGVGQTAHRSTSQNTAATRSSSSHRSSKTSSTSSSSSSSSSTASNGRKDLSHSQHSTFAHHSYHNHQLMFGADSGADFFPLTSNDDLITSFCQPIQSEEHEVTHEKPSTSEAPKFVTALSTPATHENHWSHATILDTFKCIDEDEFGNAFDQFALEPSPLSTIANKDNVGLDVSPPTASTATVKYSGGEGGDLWSMPTADHITHADSDNQRGLSSTLDTPSVAFTNTSVEALHRNCLTSAEFEEAFKNYYDSQNRISNYYTMPVKMSRERKRKFAPNPNVHCFTADRFTGFAMSHQTATEAQLPEADRFDRNNVELPLNGKEVGCNLNQPLTVTSMKASEVVNTVPEHRNVQDGISLLLGEEEDGIPFPTIEPPVDYQNATVVIVPRTLAEHESTKPIENYAVQVATMDSITNQLLQPYQYWVQQLMDQMNQTNALPVESAMPKVYNAQTIQPYGTLENAYEGYVHSDHDVNVEDEDDDEDDDEDYEEEEEDGAGDTSTSQDIADFELELDEEPIKFVGDEEYNRTKMESEQKTANNKQLVTKPNTRPQATMAPAPTTIVPPPIIGQLTIQTPPQQQSQPQPPQNQLLRNNLNLLRKAVQLNNITADYGFDGFRKGCFGDDNDDDDDSSSTTSTNSSLSSGSQTDGTNSITAEFIKPPTPFTNYYNVNSNNNQ